jgi:iron complex transport system substrate-binding protein
MIAQKFFKLTTIVALLSACQVAPPAAAPAPTSAPTVVSAVSPTITIAPTVAAAPAAVAPKTNLTEGCVDKFDPAIDYFPEKAGLKAVSGLKIEYFKNYKVVTVETPWPGATKAFQYVLVQCGTPAPTNIPDGQVINVPAKTLVAMSTTELPIIEQLGLTDNLVGIDSFLWTNNAAVQARIQAGNLVEIGGGADVNIEKTISLKPDVIFASGSGSPEYDAHPKLLEAKLNVVVDGSWMEQSPLGRAEWSKFVAVFFNREAIAEAGYAQISKDYAALAEKARAVSNKPTVLINMPYKDTWSMAGGKSYVAQLLADAGLAYNWSADASTGSLPLKFEEVLDKSAKTDLWLLNAYGTFSDTKSITDLDARYGEFGALKTGQVWNNDLQVNINGGNAFFESGSANPQLVLADLIKIAHPELLPEHKFVFYRQVGK